MKKICDWQVLLGILFVGLSIIVYVIHFMIFRDVHHIFIYLIGDIGFVFIEVLLVTLILHRVLTFREHQQMLKKLNMVIGVFFSEVGTELLKINSICDADSSSLAEKLAVRNNWSKREFLEVRRFFKNYKSRIETSRENLEKMKLFLETKRDFLVRLLENSNLLEHESFTNLLWAVFHLTEELDYRKSFKKIPEADYKHLVGDMRRAYHLLISEWLDYMKHLQSDYPYLFSLAIRTNPFDPHAQIEVK